MNSKEYWEDRERTDLRARLRQDARSTRRLNSIYDNMRADIQKQIDSFYERYADKEGISITDAKKRVTMVDISEYENKAKQYVKDRDLSPQANAEMSIYNLTMKVNRLEMLKAEIGLIMVCGFDDAEKLLREILDDRALDEFRRQAGILGKSVLNVDKRAEQIVNMTNAIAGYHWSDTLWTQQTVLKAELAKLLERGLLQGKGSRALAQELSKVMGVEKYAADRLMRTELSRVQTQAQKLSFEAAGYEEYQYITLSSAPYTKSKVCPICKDLDGKVFKVKDMQSGENAPPMHPNCRCSIAAYMDQAKFEAWLDDQSKH